MTYRTTSDPVRRRGRIGGVFADLVRRATLMAYRRDIREIRRQTREGGRIAVTRLGPIEYACEGSGTRSTVAFHLPVCFVAIINSSSVPVLAATTVPSSESIADLPAETHPPDVPL